MTNRRRWAVGVAFAVWMGATFAMARQEPAPTSSAQESPEAAAQLQMPEPVVVPADPNEAYKDDVHQQAGVTCADCHGAGAPPGPIARTRIAPLCATCHSDPAYMRRFRPQVRTDQYAQYQTSVHGQQITKGETRVATCSDCHNAHGVRQVRDARSPVAPANVAQTCARCHADESMMTPFGRDPAVYDDWSHSVHAAALVQRGDTSAPTCSTCHGSHGATPPGIDSVANVCSTCHVREAELYHDSAKRVAFESFDMPACLTCHNNHRIEHPQDSWIGLTEPALCATCHDAEMPGAAVIKAFSSGFADLTSRYDAAEALLTRAEEAGLLVDEGQVALHAANESRVQLRVLVHAFAEAPFKEALEPGVASADEAQQAGEAAMTELSFRRRGLAVATLLILGFLLTLGVKIRRLPPPPQPEA